MPENDDSAHRNEPALDEAYERLAATGPEWGEDQLTNHGPMAAEVLVRRGHADEVLVWVDSYVRRLETLPAATRPVTDADWRDALGDGRRVADWTVYFDRQLQEQPWRDVLATWWPRLLPGILAGATHGLIRVSHAVRALRAGATSDPAVTELARGLAFWAARARSIPGAAIPGGEHDVAAALGALPRIPDQRGELAARFAQLEAMPAWVPALRAVRRPAGPDAAAQGLADLVAAATARYLTDGHASPVLLVHSATAPNAALHVLPELPEHLWIPSFAAAWAASAAIITAYAPAQAAPRSLLPTPPATSTPADDVLDRATTHGDEHVIKFTDTAVEVYERTGDPDSLAAALRVADLIEPPGRTARPRSR